MKSFKQFLEESKDKTERSLARMIGQHSKAYNKHLKTAGANEQAAKSAEAHRSMLVKLHQAHKAHTVDGNKVSAQHLGNLSNESKSTMENHPVKN